MHNRFVSPQFLVWIFAEEEESAHAATAQRESRGIDLLLFSHPYKMRNETEVLVRILLFYPFHLLFFFLKSYVPLGANLGTF